MKSSPTLRITVIIVLAIIAVLLAITAIGSNGEDGDTAMAIDIPLDLKYMNLSETAHTLPTHTPAIGTPTASPTIDSSATPSPSATIAPSSKDNLKLYCTLTIKGKDIPVLYGVDEETLEKSPGFLPSSAAPGTNGICAIYGHRNRNHLKILKSAEVGDEIKVTTASGDEFIYTIIDISIYNETDSWTLPASDEKLLVLVTCYPFEYSGHAPGKCVVVGRMG